MISRRIALACALTLAAPMALAQTWPSKPIRLLVGFPAGTSTDLLARTIAETLGKALGQQVVVENRAGAGGNIAADILSKADDDHTFGIVTTGPLTTAKLLNANLPFDPDKDLASLTLIGTAPMVLVSPATNTAASAKDFLAGIKAQGDKANFASVGVGSAAHLGMELLKSKTGIAAVHIPYAGAPQIMTALIAGEVQMALMAPAAALPQAKAGKLKIWGSTAASRSVVIPDIEPLAAAGVQGFDFESWNAFSAPARMKAEYRARLERELQTIIRSPEMRSKLTVQGWAVAGTSAEGMNMRVKQDTAVMSALIKARDIKLN